MALPEAPETEMPADREPAHYRELAAVRAEAFRLLTRGVADRRSPFHTPALATVAPDGAAGLRTVVLRAFDPQAPTVDVHTDHRSAKVGELVREPRCALLFYDAHLKIQVRIAGTAVVHNGDGLARERWNEMRESSRRCYQVPVAPGTPVATPTDGLGCGHAPQPEETGFGHFVVIRVGMTALEWLYLSAHGHRRARFAWADGVETAAWLIP